MNILITSAGRRVSLVRAFQKELKEYFPQSKVFTVDNNPELSAACQVSDKFFQICKLTNENYIIELLNLCETNNIKLIIPTIDTELQLLSSNIEKFVNQNIVISNKQFIDICRDKWLTNDFFKQKGIKIPDQYTKEQFKFPLFIKPNNGSLSGDIHFIFTKEHLQEKFFTDNKYMFMEYLSPLEYDEFTCDLYYDKSSILKCIVPRKRIEVRGGEISKGITKNNQIIPHIIKKLGKIEGARGCITLQVFLGKYNQEIYGIEINPRFGGGFPLSYEAGANYPKFIIKEYLLNDNIEFFSNWKSEKLMLRFDDAVYL